MRIVLIGAVESTAVTLEALIRAGYPPVAIVSLEPELSGRHGDFVDMGALAAKAGISFIGVRSINAPDIVARLEALQPDWLVVVGWSQICQEPLLAIPRLGAIGYHPAPLPEMRGRAVLAWTILLGRSRTAGTVFRLEPTVDSGDILAQRAFDLDERETLPSLLSKHMYALKTMWDELMPRLASGDIETTIQDIGRASYCAKRTAADGLIDWQSDAQAIDRLIRAVTAPYPGAFTTVEGSKLIIWKGEIWDGPRYYGLPGQIADHDQNGILVSCGNHTALLLKQWQWSEAESGRLPRVGGRFGT